MSLVRRRLIALGLVGTTMACSTHSAPDGFLPTPIEAQTRAQGGWMEISRNGPDGLETLAGELIAVTQDSVWILRSPQATALPTSEIVEGKLTGYDSKHGDVAGATFVGTVLTASNGAFLILTAPMWMIGGSLAAGSQSRVAMEDLPPVAWAELADFARFPQGMPPGLELAELRPIPR